MGGQLSNVEDIISKMESGRKVFYHFTDIRNLESIKRDGLLSMREIRARRMSVVTGGNQWSLDADLSKGMDGFVHLCFFDEHPMEYLAKKDRRIGYSKFLEINPCVLRSQGVLISKDVSNKANASFDDAEQVIPNLDTSVIFDWMNWKDKEIQERRRAAKKYEVLIPRMIPVNLIRNI